MPKKRQKSNKNVGMAYQAIVDYHNNLVQIRFTVAGLFLVANGVLATGIFQPSPSRLTWYALPILGMFLAIICLILEVRTYQLLKNLGDRGIKLEEYLGLNEDQGFFYLMRDQPIDPRLFKGASHTIGFILLYTTICLVWLVIFSIFVACACKA